MVPRQLPNEEDIIKKAAKGDNKSFERLMMHYEKYIYNIACKYADIEQDREEVVQESMLKVWQNIGKFKFNSKFSTWLFVIVGNDSRRILTRRHTIPSHPYNSRTSFPTQCNSSDDASEFNDEDFSYLSPGYPSPESFYNTYRLEQAIFEEAGKLPDDLKQAWFLREIELYTYEDLAHTLHIPIGTAKSRVFKAREILNEELSDYLGGNTSRFNMGE